MNLKNKTIVITGASDGIGKQISLRLAKEGTNLALIARDKNRLDEVKAEVIKSGALDAKVYSCDVRNTSELTKTVGKIITDFKMVDILINNAGVWQKLGQLDEIESEVIDEVISTNLSALIHTTKLFLPYLKARDEAAIINVSSKSGVIAQEGQSVYTASKYGVRGFTEVLQLDLKDTNIKVAGLYQGGINTQMFAKTGDKFPIERFTEPADLADVVAYMLSLPKKIWLSEVRVEH